MLKKLSVKTKLYIFLLLTIVAIGIVVYDKIEKDKRRWNKTEAENSAILSQNKAEAKKAAEEKKKEEEAAEKQKKLDIKYNEALNAFQSEQYSKAVTLSDEILAVDGNNYKAYNIKGIALCYGKQFEFKEAMSNIDRAIEIKPDYGYARYNKAQAYALYSRYDEALALYDKAIEVDKNYVWNYYGKASVYGRKGDAANTVKYLKMAIDIDQKAKEEAKKDVDFANVRSNEEFQQLIK